MGYTTDFYGQFTITPPLDATTVEEINAFCAERHDNHPIGIWCDLVASPTTLEWNGAEKTYSLDQWVKYVVNEFIAPKGHRVDGFMEAQGEDPDDRWTLRVDNNVVAVQETLFIQGDIREV